MQGRRTELLAALGHARVVPGGPAGAAVELAAGDALMLPGGTGHCRAQAAPGFVVVGAYPADQQRWDLLRADPAEHGYAGERIRALPTPGSEPLAGPGGPLPRLWARARARRAGDAPT